MADSQGVGEQFLRVPISRTVFIHHATGWPSLERKIARAERAGEPLVITGKGDWARRLVKRVHETYPDVHWGFDADTKEHTATVGRSRQVVVKSRVSPARRA